MEPITTLQDKAELARILNVDPDDLATLTPRWLGLMQQGVIVQLTVRRWRAQAKLDSADLGLPRAANDLIDDLLALGNKRLLPLELTRELTAIESAGRKTLDRFGYATHWGTFIPVTNFDAWRTANDEHKARYFQLRNRIYDNYSSILADLMDEYCRAASLAYARIVRLDPSWPRSESSFTSEFTQRISSLIPSADAIYASFAWQESLSYIPLPAMLNQANTPPLTLEEAADQERYQMLTRMNQEVVADARRQKQELIDTFLSDLAVQLRTLIYTAATDVLATMQRNQDRLHPRSVVQLRNLIKQVQQLNFFGDVEADTLIDQVRASFDQQDADNRNHAQIQEVLTDVATVVRHSLLVLDPSPRPLRTPPPDADPALSPDQSLQRARRRLQLDPMPSAPNGIPVDVSSLFRAARQLSIPA